LKDPTNNTATIDISEVVHELLASRESKYVQDLDKFVNDKIVEIEAQIKILMRNNSELSENFSRESNTDSDDDSSAKLTLPIDFSFFYNKLKEIVPKFEKNELVSALQIPAPMINVTHTETQTGVELSVPTNDADLKIIEKKIVDIEEKLSNLSGGILNQEYLVNVFSEDNDNGSVSIDLLREKFKGALRTEFAVSIMEVNGKTNKALEKVLHDAQVY